MLSQVGLDYHLTDDAPRRATGHLMRHRVAMNSKLHWQQPPFPSTPTCSLQLDRRMRNLPLYPVLSEQLRLWLTEI